MTENYLKPKGVDTKDLGHRRMKDGQFHNPPLYEEWGGFTSASKGRWDQNKMSLEKGGPQSVRGRPI